VLSATTAAPRAAATLARAAKSCSSKVREEGDSRNSAFVLGFMRASSSSGVAVGGKYVVSTAKRRRKWSQKERVGPYTPSDTSTWSPALRKASMAQLMAATPDATTHALSAPSTTENA